jgi:hypothetical protein
MGWRGAVRSMSAAMRAAERDAERRRKQYAKAQMIAHAGDAVADWQTVVRDLVSIHKNPANEIDWTSILNKPSPEEPPKLDFHEADARQRLEAFKPSFFDFLRGGSEKRRDRLVQAVSSGIDRDEQDYAQASAQYRDDREEWQADTALARRLLAGDNEAKRDVINEMQSLSQESLIGSRMSFEMSDNYLHAVVHVHGKEVVPDFRRKQLQSGRLSETKMPVGEFYELYQDYVCSVALRLAADLFALLPIQEAYVTCVALMLNTNTGHQEDTPILSTRFVRETFRRLNLKGLDPSDAMPNFVHVMDFKRGRGFSRIDALKRPTT